MINFLCSLTIFASLCSPTQLGALSILKPSQGGTGIGTATAGDVGKVLKVSDDSPFTFVLATDDTGSGGGSAAVSTSTNETAGNLAYWTSTSATPALLGKVATSSVTINAPLTSAGTAGFVVGGSGWTLDIDDIKAADLDLTDITLSDFLNDAGFQTFAYLFPSNATTTNITFSNGLTGNLTGNASTATSLAANGANCSSGSAPLGVDASGAVESCFDVWTEAENTSAAYISNITGESIEDLSDVAAMTKNYGDLLFWNGSTWTDIATSSLGISSSAISAYEIATTSTISVPQLAYFTQASGRTTLGGVSTTTVTASGALSFSQPVVTLGGASSALSIADAAADGSTKGAASFTAADFNSSSGNISIDYTNGQSAASGVKGFLTGTDWDTFNAKESALTFTYPLTRAVNAISLAFGTTTSNTWAGTQTFTNSPVFTSLTGGLVVSNAGSDTIFNVATTTLTLPSAAPFNPSGTLGNLVGGTNFTLGYYGIATSSAIANTEVIYGTAVNTIDSEAAFSYNATADRLTVTHASTTASSMTNLDVSGISVLPSGTAPTVSSAGAIANDTSTINGLTQLVYGASAHVLQPMSWAVAGHATSTWTATTTQYLAPAPAAITVTTARCETSTGTVGVSLYDGTNRANFFTASTTIGTITFSTNNTFTLGESMRVDFGTPASSPTQVACRFGYTYTRQ